MAHCRGHTTCRDDALDGIAVCHITVFRNILCDAQCIKTGGNPGPRRGRWRLCHSASTSSCSRYCLTTLSGRTEP